MQRFALLFFLVISLGVACEAQDDTRQPCPCCGPEYRQFDFWLGDWITTTPDGKTAGTNNIVLLQDSCILQENWASAQGAYTGTSYNYYDRSDGLWHQLWIDNQGQTLDLKGTREGSQMILSSDPVKTPDGKMIVNRITWTAKPDGTVRQLWETSTDKGEWTVAFDGLYRKKKMDQKE